VTDSRISAGLIPFVQCDHGDGPEWMPAHYRTGRLTHLISCVACLRTFDDSQVRWLTPTDARQRLGWTLVESEGGSTV